MSTCIFYQCWLTSLRVISVLEALHISLGKLHARNICPYLLKRSGSSQMPRLDGSPPFIPRILLLNDNSQEVDYDMMSILNARLGVGGRYRAHPSQAPLEKGYFTLVYIRVETVEVHSSAREVSVCCWFVVVWS